MSKKALWGSTLIASVLASGMAYSAPVILAGEAQIYFNNFENAYRSAEDCRAGGCLASIATDPNGYQRIDPSLPGNIRVGDIFAGVLNVQNITSTVLGTDTYNSVSGDRFTGYFAQRVAAISFNPLVSPVAQVTLGTAVDPFGILAAGEMFRFYSGVASFSSAGTVASSIASATGGTFWGSFGIGSEGYAYTRTDFTVALGNSQTKTESFTALDLILAGPSYSAGLLNKINDYNEDLVGGSILNVGTQLCTAAEIAAANISCTDAVGTSEIEANAAFNAGLSPWMFKSNDPFYLNRIPEPGSLALAGLALVGLGVARRRKAG